MLRNYTRWRQHTADLLRADILGAKVTVGVSPGRGLVFLGDELSLSPDEARMIGVRLIDAAVLADGDRAIRALAGS